MKSTNGSVTFEPLDRHIDVPEGATIMDAAHDVGFQLADHMRLACMTQVQGNVTVRVTAGSLVTEQRVQLDGWALEANAVDLDGQVAPEISALADYF